MRSQAKPKRVCRPCLLVAVGAALSLVVGVGGVPAAQALDVSDDEYGLGMPVENAIVGREWAFRLRTDVQFSEDDELLRDDPRYKQVPVRIYAGDLRAFHVEGWELGVTSEFWDSEQDADSWRQSVSGGLPLGDALRARLKVTRWDREGPVDRDYGQVGLSARLTPRLYSHTMVRLSAENESFFGHQLRQTLTWAPRADQRWTLTGSYYRQETGYDSAYVRATMTQLLLSDTYALRLETEHAQASPGPDYNEHDVYLYRRLWAGAWGRVGYRVYYDGQNALSQAGEIRAKQYLSPTTSLHLGYRQYENRGGPGFGTVFAGLSVIL